MKTNLRDYPIDTIRRVNPPYPARDRNLMFNIPDTELQVADFQMMQIDIILREAEKQVRGKCLWHHI